MCVVEYSTSMAVSQNNLARKLSCILKSNIAQMWHECTQVRHSVVLVLCCAVLYFFVQFYAAVSKNHLDIVCYCVQPSHILFLCLSVWCSMLLCGVVLCVIVLCGIVYYCIVWCCVLLCAAVS